jgi:hypothetical protein
MARSTGVGGCGVDRQQESMSRERETYKASSPDSHPLSASGCLHHFSLQHLDRFQSSHQKPKASTPKRTAIMPSQMDKSHASHIQSYTAVRSLPLKHFVDLCFCYLHVCASKTRSRRLQARGLRCALRARLTGMPIRRVVLRAVVLQGRARREAVDRVEVGRVEVEAGSRGQVGRKAGP